MADGDETMEDASVMVEGKASSTAATASAAVSASGGAGSGAAGGKMFTLKKWNGVAMWSWDVECDTCAICRVQVMDACLRCQAENKVRLVDAHLPSILMLDTVVVSISNLRRGFTMLYLELITYLLYLFLSAWWLRGRMGRLQSLLPQLLHESLGKTEQPLPSMSTRVGRSKNREVNFLCTGTWHPSTMFYFSFYFILCLIPVLYPSLKYGVCVCRGWMS